MDKDLNIDLQDLILAYDRATNDRDNYQVPDWKKQLRRQFLEILIIENKSSLIDIGSGTGLHAKYFQEHDFDVTCIDLSPANVQKCVEKGLESYVLNVLDLVTMNKLFDSAFALNSLLHIPTRLLPNALSNISDILKPNGLLFWGQYGGEYREGVYENDGYEPKRFFSLLDDVQVHEIASCSFIVEDFDTVSLEGMSPLYFQSMLLRVKE